MSQMVGTDEIESSRIELSEVGRSLRSSFRLHASSFRSSSALSSGKDDADVEYALQWAPIEILPTLDRLRSSLFDKDGGMATDKGKQVIDITKLGAPERRMFMEKVIKHIENDNLQLLRKIRSRIDIVGVKLPVIEVRYKNLHVEAECEVVHGKPLPTLWTSVQRKVSDVVRLSGAKPHEAKISIVNHASGIIKPGRYKRIISQVTCILNN
ncbi:hypothetical protein REPUB_Repub06bG0001200 [Reevesia pubescens]